MTILVGRVVQCNCKQSWKKMAKTFVFLSMRISKFEFPWMHISQFGRLNLRCLFQIQTEIWVILWTYTRPQYWVINNAYLTGELQTEKRSEIHPDLRSYFRVSIGITPNICWESVIRPFRSIYVFEKLGESLRIAQAHRAALVCLR